MKKRSLEQKLILEQIRKVEQQLLLGQIKQVAKGIGETFAPFCEVVVHDLLNPRHSIVALYNNLSGRTLGGPATDHGLVRIADPTYAQVVSNYANQFSDGRHVKSTSIGVKDSAGRYIASLCLNIDLTLFRGMENVLSQFSALDADAPIKESLDPAGADAIRAHIDHFAARISTTPRSLKLGDRRTLIRELKKARFMDVRRAADITARHLGVSRSTVYADAR